MILCKSAITTYVQLSTITQLRAFNCPKNYRILCDRSSYEEPTFATMDQPVEWPKWLVPTTPMYHKQACHNHYD